MFRVLLPVDRDAERAAKSVSAIESLPNASEHIEVTILNVQPRVDVSDGEGHADSREWYDEAEIPETMEHSKAKLESEGVNVTLRREHADPAETIIDVANEIEADRIVMSGRKRSQVGKMLFGSVTQSVLLNANVPVTVTS